MRKSLAVLAAVTAAVLAGGTLWAPVTAAPSTSKAGSVKLNPIPAKSEVGKKLTLSGKVSGADRGVKVKLQRKYASGAWVTVATDKTNKQGKYAAKVTLLQGGPTSFRAVKGARRSSLRSLAVYQWLDVGKQPQYVGEPVIMNQPVTIGGRSFPYSYQSPEFSGLYTYVNNKCTMGEAYIGFRDVDVPKLVGGETMGMVGVGVTAAGDPIGSTVPVFTPVGPAKRVAFNLTNAAYAWLQFGFDSAPADSTVFAVMASPRLYCNAPALGAFNDAPLMTRSAVRNGRYVS